MENLDLDTRNLLERRHVRIVAYHPKQCSQWNDFLYRAKNWHFMFDRNYMDYHSDRFEDGSLLAFQDDQLVGILPASLRDDTLSSHGGLTFGGWLTSHRMSSELMLAIFQELKNYLRQQGINKLMYKAMPHIYHDAPAEEDLYALFRHDARLIRRDVSSSIHLRGTRSPYTKGRKWTINKGMKAGLDIRQSEDFDSLIRLASENLTRKYNKQLTHTEQEMLLLAGRFPQNIKLYTASKGSELLAGAIVYENKRTAHAQYIASSDEGKETGAADLLIDQLLAATYADWDYFDFGISTEQNGRYLNSGLSLYKEGFGARAVCYDTYELTVNG